MAGDGVREGPELSRRIRDELERIRDAEARVEEALETVRQARRRVEVIARELGREEERVRAWVREELKVAAGPSSGTGGAAGGTASATQRVEERSAGRDEEPESGPGEAQARSWRSDAPLGWSTWREAPVPPREGFAAAAARVAGSPTAPTPPAAPPPTSPPPAGAAFESGPAAEDRRPTAPEVDALRAPLDPRFAPAAAASIRPDGSVVGPVPTAYDTDPDARDRSAWWTRVALGVLAALAVGLVGWLAIRGLSRESAEAPPPTETAPAAATTPAPEPAAAPPPVVETPAAAEGPLATLPTDAAARQTLYDSLFAARSPLFDPLLAQIETETEARPLRRALGAWREGPIDAGDADLIHSALLQHVLRADVDPRIEIDGQVLRNPCRGSSCTALLTAWQQRAANYGLPAVPENAATDPRALHQAEAALVLGWLRQANVGAAPTATP